MHLNRRQALKQFAIITAGVSLIPSCMQDKNKASIILKNLQVGGDQEQLLAELAETIIPATDTPGAKDISAHLFVLKMMDDCYAKEDQQKFMKGLEQFEKEAKSKTGKSFVNSAAQERAAVLTEIEARKDKKDDLSYFYNTTKRLTIQAYTTSEFYLTKVSVYEMIPVPYKGCVPVTKQVS